MLKYRSKYKKVITVLVGPGEESYEVHKDLICASSRFFKAACNRKSVEGMEDVVHLPNDDPETFELLLQWLYMERVAEPGKAALVGWHETASLYTLAVKLQILELQDAVVDLWIHKATDAIEIPIEEVPYVYRTTLEHAPLRQLLVEMVACGGGLESLCQVTDELPREFLVDLAVRLMQLRRNDVFVKARFWYDLDFYHECPARDNKPEMEAYAEKT